MESGCTQPDGQASHDSIVVLSLAAYAVKRPAKHTLQKSAAVSLGWPLPPPVSPALLKPKLGMLGILFSLRIPGMLELTID